MQQRASLATGAGDVVQCIKNAAGIEIVVDKIQGP